MEPRVALWRLDSCKGMPPLSLARHLWNTGNYLIFFLVWLLIADVARSWLGRQFLPFFIMGGFVGFSIYWMAVTNAWRRKRLVRRLSPLMADPCPLGQHAVEILLLEEGHRYGDDQGVVSFVDGWMHYEGKACSFALSPRNVVSIADERHAAPKGMRAPWTHPLRLLIRAGDGRRVLLAMTSCYAEHWFTQKKNGPEERAFREELEAWRTGPQPAEGTVLPPLEPQAALTRWDSMPYLTGGICLAAVAAFGVGAALLSGGMNPGAAFLPLLLAGGSFYCFRILVERNRLFARMRRLAESRDAFEPGPGAVPAPAEAAVIHGR